jgi:hypothetical protein
LASVASDADLCLGVRWISWVGTGSEFAHEERARTRRAGGDGLYPTSAEAVAQRAHGRVERRLQPKAADHDHVPAGREHAHHLIEEHGRADLGHQLKRAVCEGQPLGVADQELDAVRELGWKLRPRPRDHRLREVQARDPSFRKLAGEPQCSGTCSGAEIEGRGGRRLEPGDRGGERRQVLRRVGPHALVPAARQPVEEGAQRPAHQRPGPGSARNQPRKGLPDHADRQRRRRTGAFGRLAHAATLNSRFRSVWRRPPAIAAHPVWASSAYRPATGRAAPSPHRVPFRPPSVSKRNRPEPTKIQFERSTEATRARAGIGGKA